MSIRWQAVGILAFFALGVMGCTIITTTGNDQKPPPRHRSRRPRHDRPKPPPRPHKKATGVPAPSPAPGPKRITPTLHHSMKSDLPPQPPKTDPPSTPTRPTVMASGAAAGRPRGFTVGAAPAYWIWQGPRGGWRIRTTTKKALHVFRGRITPIKTTISSMSPSRTELRDRVWKKGDSWMFSFKTAAHADGITFQTKHNGCVKFDLQLDGGPVTKRIVVGKGQASPATNHFILCPHGKKL